MKSDIITILCSGASLGVYIPGVIAQLKFKQRGFNSEVVVVQDILLEEKRKNVPKAKQMFHRNFAFALTAQKLAKDISPNLDPVRVENLLRTWKQEKRKRFIVLSGFWLPVMQLYLQETDIPDLSIDLLHIDTCFSPSWDFYDTAHPAFKHDYLFSWEQKKLLYSFPVSEDEIIPYQQRSNRFLIHGGGWGLGTYQGKIPELAERGIPLDVIIYEPRDLENKVEGNRYFTIDPTWNPWDKNERGEHQFPPFGEVRDDDEVIFQNNPLYPEVYNLVRQSRGIISKPGGATLVDSFSAATPLIWLEPYGAHENNNGMLWEGFGFAVSYQKWAESGYSIDLLEELHENLRQARAELPSYVDCYAKTYDLSSTSI